MTEKELEEKGGEAEVTGKEILRIGSSARGLKFCRQITLFSIIVLLLIAAILGKTIVSDIAACAATSRAIDAKIADNEQKIKMLKGKIAQVEEKMKKSYNVNDRDFFQAQCQELAKLSYQLHDCEWEKRQYNNVDWLVPSDYKKPELIKPVFVLNVIAGLFALLMMYVVLYSWRQCENSAKDCLTFDFENGNCHFLTHYTFNRDLSGTIKFDTLTSVRVYYGIYGVRQNVAKITIEGKRFNADEIEDVSFSLKYCDNPAGICARINERLRAKSLDALKIHMVN